MIRGLLFDMGGTLDADGADWLTRFAAAYASCGMNLGWNTVRAAFDHAERLATTDSAIPAMGVEPMVERHVTWQLEYLLGAGSIAEPPLSLHGDLVRAFVDPMRSIARRNAGLLAALKTDGFLLGVVSNGCGNVDRLCADLGYAPWLSTVVDSRRVGIAKPDSGIYALAARNLGVLPSAIMMIGDSFERDVRPARAIGMKTAWVEGVESRPCPDPSLVDVCLHTLAELPQALDARARTVA